MAGDGAAGRDGAPGEPVPGEPAGAGVRGVGTAVEWPRFSSRALVMWRRNWLAWRYYMVTSITANLVQPVLNLLALGFGVGLFVQDVNGLPFIQFIGPGLLIGSTMQGVTFDLCYGVFDRLHWTRAYHAVIASPLMPRDIVAGEMLWQATRSAFFGTGFLLILAAFGLVSSWWALTVPLLAALVALVFSGPAIAVASVARAEEQLSYYFNLVIQPVFFFSGVFFPIEALGSTAARVAQFIPLYHGVSLVRAAVTGVPPTLPVWVHALWLGAFAVLALALPTRFLRGALERLP